MCRQVGLVHVFVLAAALIVISCGTEATDTAKVCAQGDLIEQCPAGTTPQLEASATSQCDGKIDGSVIEEKGSATGSCAGTGDCKVLCQFSTPCNCGVASLTRNEVQCVTPCDRLAVCGNGACEDGESIQNCHVDCGSGVCIAGTTRCNGDSKQECNQVGEWDDLACPTDTFCRGEGVCVDESCVPACDGKSCGDNGCGRTCGACSATQYCEAGVCAEGTCTSNCTGRLCGDDGCGNPCGFCSADQHCEAGVCAEGTCTSDCTGRLCGDDGCGNPCGVCSADQHCEAGVCAGDTCTTDCTGRLCGDDGCGGTCGECGAQQYCSTDSLCYGPLSTLGTYDFSPGEFGTHVGIDQDSVYWMNQYYEQYYKTDLWRSSKDGITVETIAQDLHQNLAGVEADTTHIYLYGGGGGTGAKLGRITKMDGVFEMLDDFAIIDYPRLDDTHLFWKSDYKIMSMLKTSSVPTTVATIDELRSFNINGQDIFATSGSLAVGTLHKVSKWGGPVDDIASGIGYFSSVAVSETYVYWTVGSEGMIQVMAKTGGTPITILDDLSISGSVYSLKTPQLFADETGVYWVSNPDARLMHITPGDWDVHEITAGDCYAPEGVKLATDGDAFYWAACGKVNKLPR